ncbi:MAG: hypothetical protein RIQ56_937 [Candidatus Parcubacteria bacterium]|jgi:hypothetical protein
MTRNPFLNAAAASCYIILVVSIITYVPKLTGANERPDTIFAPIAMLSLFVFSAAIMAYLFMYQPLTMFLEGEKQSALKLFIQTLGAFGLITFAFLAVAFLSMS